MNQHQQRVYDLLADYGFKMNSLSENKIDGIIQGKKYFLLLEVDCLYFNLKLDDGLLNHSMFYWQSYSSYEQIVELMQGNLILRTELAYARKRAKTRLSKAGQHE